MNYLVWFVMSDRAHNLLSYAGFPVTKEAVLQALNTGQLPPYKRPRRYGKVTHAELCCWADVDPTTLPPPR